MTDKEITFDECMLDAIEAIKDAMGRLDVGYGLWPMASLPFKTL